MRSRTPSSVSDLCQSGGPDAREACEKFQDAKAARGLTLAFGGAGLALLVSSVVVLLTGDAKAPAPPKAAVLPRVSPSGGGVDLRLSF